MFFISRKIFAVLTLLLMMLTLVIFFTLSNQLAQNAASRYDGIEWIGVLYGSAGFIFGVLLGLEIPIAEGRKPGRWRIALFPLLIKGIPFLLLALIPILALGFLPIPLPLASSKLVGKHIYLLILLMALALGNTVTTSLHKGE